MVLGNPISPMEGQGVCLGACKGLEQLGVLLSDKLSCRDGEHAAVGIVSQVVERRPPRLSPFEALNLPYIRDLS